MSAKRPGPLRWLAYAYGAGLPERYDEWVLRDTTSRTWWLRHLARAIIQIAPIIVGVMLLLPGPLWIRLAIVFGGGLLSLIFSFAYVVETTEHRLVKAGYASGTGERIRASARPPPAPCRPASATSASPRERPAAPDSLGGMHKILLALHLLFAIFAIGPLVHAATTASRGVRDGDAKATAASARMVRIYSYASLLVVVFGFGMVQKKFHAQFSDTWVWLSIALWVVAIGLVLALLVPALEKAGTEIEAGQPVQSLVGRVSAVGGIVALIFAGIVFLMVYQP